MDDTFLNMQGHLRAPRCSMPSLDFHGLKLPNASVSKSRISLPAVANTIKQHISKTSRRASLAAIELYNTKLTNGDIKKRKFASDDLGTMHEEDDDDTRDSALSSRATSESGDVFSRISVSDSISSDRTASMNSETKPKTRHNSEIADSDKEDKDKLAKIQEEAKRRHSESILDKGKFKFSVSGFSNDVVTFRHQNGKTFTKPALATDTYSKQSGSDNDIKKEESETENNNTEQDENDSSICSTDGMSGKGSDLGESDNNNETSVKIDIDDLVVKDAIPTTITTEIMMEDMSNGAVKEVRARVGKSKDRENWV